MKGQTALEYLMTYGWAILIIVVVVAALFAMNVFNPGAWTGESASGFASFKVDAFSFSSGGIVNFTLGNKLGQTITVTKVSVTEATGATAVNNSSSFSLGPNGEISYSIAGLGALTQGTQYSVDTKITYTWQGQTKFDDGMISGKTS